MNQENLISVRLMALADEHTKTQNKLEEVTAERDALYQLISGGKLLPLVLVQRCLQHARNELERQREAAKK